MTTPFIRLSKALFYAFLLFYLHTGAACPWVREYTGSILQSAWRYIHTENGFFWWFVKSVIDNTDQSPLVIGCSGTKTPHVCRHGYARWKLNLHTFFYVIVPDQFVHLLSLFSILNIQYLPWGMSQVLGLQSGNSSSQLINNFNGVAQGHLNTPTELVSIYRLICHPSMYF